MPVFLFHPVSRTQVNQMIFMKNGQYETGAMLASAKE